MFQILWTFLLVLLHHGLGWGIDTTFTHILHIPDTHTLPWSLVCSLISGLLFDLWSVLWSLVWSLVCSLISGQFFDLWSALWSLVCSLISGLFFELWSVLRSLVPVCLISFLSIGLVSSCIEGLLCVSLSSLSRPPHRGEARPVRPAPATVTSPSACPPAARTPAVTTTRWAGLVSWLVSWLVS